MTTRAGRPAVVASPTGRPVSGKVGTADTDVVVVASSVVSEEGSVVVVSGVVDAVGALESLDWLPPELQPDKANPTTTIFAKLACILR